MGVGLNREAHLFACHKYLEEKGSQILLQLAKADFRDSEKINSILIHLHSYVSTLENHAKWENEFIFSKFFRNSEISTFLSEHSTLEKAGNKLVAALRDLSNLEPLDRLSAGKRIYLDFRRFYASNLVHFHIEETDFLVFLQSRASDDEIRAIDKPIYESMTSDEIVEMLESLLPPTNSSEKKEIIEDLRNFNSMNLENSVPRIRGILTSEECIEIFGK